MKPRRNSISIGLDIGSVNAKLVVIAGDQFKHLEFAPNGLLRIETAPNGINIVRSEPLKVQGDPVGTVKKLLSEVLRIWPDTTEQNLQVTGSHGKLISQLLCVPYLNEFKAVARGAAYLCPEVRTILEIGGDGSKYLRVEPSGVADSVSIVDYQRNGDCAAGTGSFIDQQANRLRYRVEEIGGLVERADGAASIAGRCSVFAKSDMIHAQQRGFHPAEILKGLCEAVVRNYKGTVLRGKPMMPTVLFVGGVAANAGVVAALRESLQMNEKELFVPKLHTQVSALGCALEALISTQSGLSIKVLEHVKRKGDEITTRAPKLDTHLVEFTQRPQNDEKQVSSSMPIEAYLGIDIGSVSTNLAVINADGDVLAEIYTSTDGRPVKVVQRELKNIYQQIGPTIAICGVGTTGSGRELIGELVGADTIVDEITAHKTGADFMAKELFGESVDTIFEIGGQDSKFISIKDGTVVDFAMNEACAAGTGSFLEEQADKMGISIKHEFAELALRSNQPLRLGERCTVFMEKDVTAFLQRGAKKDDIAAGLAYAVVHNYLNRVVRRRKIGNVIYFQGGTAYNAAVAAAFATVLGKRIVIPPHNGVIGAIGVALLAKERALYVGKQTLFRGFDLSQVKYRIRNIQCKGCANKCDVQEFTVDGAKTYWGDKCSQRFRKTRPPAQKPVIPDLISLRQKLLLQAGPGPNGLGLRIGIPRSLYFYDLFPFWCAYFRELGAEVVISDVTNRDIVAKGREACVAEPCFPLVVAHGHVKELLEQDVDFFFMPSLVNTESEVETESWFCPWGQTVPYVAKSSPVIEHFADRFLTPAVRFRDGQRSVERSLAEVAKRLGISRKMNKKALEIAFATQKNFEQAVQQAGAQALNKLDETGQAGIVLLGRPYNIYDRGVNLNIPEKLRQNFGINVIPLDFLPLAGINVSDVHENMFWNYGRKILQAAKFIGKSSNLRAIYITNFKCGPDSYIKHFVDKAMGKPFLVLQFDGHGNDAGFLTRCEAFLKSSNLITEAKLVKNEYV